MIKTDPRRVAFSLQKLKIERKRERQTDREIQIETLRKGKRHRDTYDTKTQRLSAKAIERKTETERLRERH